MFEALVNKADEMANRIFWPVGQSWDLFWRGVMVKCIILIRFVGVIQFLCKSRSREKWLNSVVGKRGRERRNIKDNLSGSKSIKLP